MNNKLRTFKLIDQEGYLSKNHTSNLAILNTILVDGFLRGCIGQGGNLVDINDKNIYLILKNEFQYFEEVFPEENSPKEETLTKEPPSPNQILPTQEAFSEGFFDKMSQRIKEDCIATGGTLCVDEDSMYFLWEEEEYIIEDETSYQKVIDSIKVLTSVRR